MLKSISRLLPVLFLLLVMMTATAQPIAKGQKPYTLMTSGKQITIKSSKTIQQIMLWTSSGNRVVEQKGINTSSYTVNIPINHKAFFLMIGLNDGKVYTEKIGVQ